ncbi:alpha/beta hydrolase [Parasphingorhabdus sp.]|uniref:alpha/beta fold hydrolase n=1 Tax=Parasphingorhabdus sp. TaxID=2709688 RepID=UPI003267CC2F
MRFFKWAGSLILILILGAAIILGTMRLGWWNPSYEQVKAEYATPPSEFIQVGDASVHIRDEGEGPVIIMLHSSMANLRQWDDWADLLKKDYRVIRFDWAPYGLTIDPNPPTGMPGAVQLLEAVVAQKQLETFTLVGSSSGATVSVLYASAHPEKVRALALSALPLKAPPPTDFSQLTWGLIWVHQNLIPNYNSRLYYRQTMSELYGKPERLTPEVVDWYYKTNTIPGGYARVRAYYEANKKAVWATGAGDYAAKVQAPILLQWGDRDPVLPIDMATDAVKQFAGTDVTLVHYPDTGHYPMLENNVETGADLKTFLAKVHANETGQ